MIQVKFITSAENGLGNLEKHIIQRILKKIRWLPRKAKT